MKVLLFFIVFSSMTVGVLLMLLYLMTLIDPGLMDLPAKAAKMIQIDNVGLESKDTSILPPENYVDFEEFIKKKALNMN